MDELNKAKLAQNERITILAEECAEVQQIICKALRHGMGSHNPLDKSDEQPNNREMLEKELGDLMFSVEQVVLHCDVSESAIIEHCASKMLRIAPYLHHTEPKQRPPTPCLTDARLVEAHQRLRETLQYCLGGLLAVREMLGKPDFAANHIKMAEEALGEVV